MKCSISQCEQDKSRNMLYWSQMDKLFKCLLKKVLKILIRNVEPAQKRCIHRWICFPPGYRLQSHMSPVSWWNLFRSNGGGGKWLAKIWWHTTYIFICKYFGCWDHLCVEWQGGCCNVVPMLQFLSQSYNIAVWCLEIITSVTHYLFICKYFGCWDHLCVEW